MAKVMNNFHILFGIFPLPKIKSITLSHVLKVLRFFSLLVLPCPWPRFQCKLQKENLLWKENSRHVHFNQLPFDTKFATKIKRKQEMELFVTKPSKQHKNVIFSPFVHSCINIKVFLDNIAARLKSRNAFPFLQQLPSLSWLIIFYRGEFDQDYLSFSFSWVKRGD